MDQDNEIAGPNALKGITSDAPTVSVIVPTWKRRDLIGRTLDSVFAQTWTDYEVIVVNDGSPDDTETVLQPLIDAGKIRYVRQENAGVSVARNRGISLARGEFIALLDDDDLWPPNKLAVQVELMRANPSAPLVYGSLSYIGPDDEPYVLLNPEGKPWRLPCDGPDNPGPSGQVFETFTIDNWITSPGQTLVRRSTLIEMGEPYLDSAIWGCEDWDLWLRLAERGEFVYHPAIALRYRFHGHKVTHNITRLNFNMMKVLRKHRNRQRSCPSRFQLLTKRCAEKRFYIYINLLPFARQACRQGKIREALKILFFLAKTYPRCCIKRQYLRAFRDIAKAMLLKTSTSVNEVQR